MIFASLAITSVAYNGTLHLSGTSSEQSLHNLFTDMTKKKHHPSALQMYFLALFQSHSLYVNIDIVLCIVV